MAAVLLSASAGLPGAGTAAVRPNDDRLVDSVTGLSVRVPDDWRGSLSGLRLPRATVDRLRLSTYEIETSPLPARCPTQELIRRMPADGALVWVMERLTPSRALLRSLPPRPPRYTLTRRETRGCFRGAYRWRFRTGGRAITVVALLASAVTPTTRQRTADAIASLRVEPVVVGRSRQGRPIKLIAAGSARGGPRILVVGCIHGDECAAAAVVNRLRAAPSPSSDLWLMPTLNPDGRATRQRQNSAGVDLNRNFPRTWERVGSRGDRYYPGPGPASERETRVGMHVVRRLRPDITIWFHQPEINVRAGGGSERAARAYARLVGLPYLPLPVPPGAATAWQTRTIKGSQAFVVELPAGPLSADDAARHVRAIRALGAR